MRRATGWISTALLVAVAAFLGVRSVTDPGVVLPLAGVGLFLLGTTLALLLAEANRSTRSWLVQLALAAVTIRLLLLVLIHFRLSPYFFAPDALTYEYYGAALRDYWMGLAPRPGRVFEGWEVGYFFVNGISYYLFTDSPLGPVVLNLFASVWACLLAFFFGRVLFGPSEGRIAAVLAAFFPSLVLWSVLNIRDALSTFLIVSVVFLAVRSSTSARARHVLGLAGGLLLLSFLRDYMAVLVLAGLLLGFVAGLRSGRPGWTLALGALASVALVWGARYSGLLPALTLDAPLETLEYVRQDLARGAGSAYGGLLDTSTPAGVLVSLPIGLAYFLLAPFPWAMEGVLQMVTLPEVLLWYGLIPFTVLGFREALRLPRRGALVPIGVLIVVVSAYALVEGNVGTAYRHRAQVMPLFFLFSAAGIHRWRGRRVERPRGTGDPHREASSPIPGPEKGPEPTSGE